MPFQLGEPKMMPSQSSRSSGPAWSMSMVEAWGALYPANALAYGLCQSLHLRPGVVIQN